MADLVVLAGLMEGYDRVSPGCLVCAETFAIALYALSAFFIGVTDALDPDLYRERLRLPNAGMHKSRVRTRLLGGCTQVSQVNLVPYFSARPRQMCDC